MKLPVLSGRYWLALAGVLIISVLAGTFATHQLVQARLAEQRLALTSALDYSVESLEGEANRSPAMGATTLMGLNDDVLKAAARGQLPTDAPAVLARLSVAQALFDADGAYVISAAGLIVAHATANKRATNTNVAFRPYFKQAMAGTANVYAAVGTVSDERGLYYAAPLHDDQRVTSPVIGAVMVKVSSQKIDQLLRFAGGETLLLSPQGVVFSATRADWLLTMAGPASTQRVAQIRELKQFGSRFEVDAPQLLRFDPAADAIRLDGHDYLAVRKAVNWNDPAGRWQAISLHNTALLVPFVERLRIGAVVFAVMAAVGLLMVQVWSGRRRIAAARARYDTLGTALEISPISVVIANKAGNIDWVNPQFEKDTGYTLAELAGRNVGLILDGKTQKQHFVEMARTLLSGKTWRGDLFNQRKDGTHFSGHTLAAPIFDAKGQVAGFVGLQEDTTQEQHLQAQLADQIAFQNLLVDTIPVPLFYKGADARYLGFNRAFEEAFNLNRHDLVGKHVMELTTVSEADRTHYRHEDARVIREASSVRRQLVMPYADGQQHSTLYFVQGFRRQDGSPGGLVGTFVDMSEQERAQTQLRQAKELADAASRAKGDFLANMSHEIRTPMNAIIGMAHLAMKTNLTVQQADYVAKIQQSGQNLLALINDILDVSKVEAGKLSIEHIPFDLERVFSHVITVVGDKARGKGLTLDCEIAADVPHNLIGDPLRLGQILINYANNAVKFTESGSIRIVVHVQQKFDDGVALVFEVTDTGIGVSTEQATRLFQSFEQADTSTTRQYGGTGLGLAICKALAGLMGGEVGVESALGAGATFWFTVRVGVMAKPGQQARGPSLTPLAAAPQADTEATTRLALADFLGARILLVEDNELNQQVGIGLLEDAGFAADIASNGRIAVDRVTAANAAGRPYDIVLMDLQMPVLDGLGATRELRADTANLHLPIAAMTANVMQEDRERCQAAGMNGFIPKPIEPAQLWRTLVQLIRPRDGLGLAPGVSIDSVKHGVNMETRKPGPEIPGDIEGLDTGLGLRRVVGRKTLYLTLLQKFAHQHAHAIDEVEDAMGALDWRRAERVAHTLKGVAGNIGASALEAAAGALEAAIHQRQPYAMIKLALVQPRHLLKSLVAQLQQKLPAARDLDGAGAYAPAQVAAVCQELARLLAEQDFDASELFDQNLDLLALALGPRFHELRVTIDGFKFDAALLILQGACHDNQISLK
jgi:two-component system, sensor histidine kinase and response regulator